MVLRVKPTPTRLPTDSLYTPMDNTPLHSISSVPPGGLLLLLLLLLFGHSAKSKNAQEWLHLPHAIVVRLHVRKSNGVILTPETLVTVGV